MFAGQVVPAHRYQILANLLDKLNEKLPPIVRYRSVKQTGLRDCQLSKKRDVGSQSETDDL